MLKYFYERNICSYQEILKIIFDLTDNPINITDDHSKKFLKPRE